MNAFMNFIATECFRKGITQAKLAAMADLTEASVCRYFKGEREPRLTNMNKMLNALGYELMIIEKEK